MDPRQAAAQSRDFSETGPKARLLPVVTNTQQLDSSQQTSKKQVGLQSKMGEQLPEEKRFDPRDTTLKFVNRPDDLDPFRK